MGNKTKEARIVNVLDFFGSDETSLQDLCTADGITVQAARRTATAIPFIFIFWK